MLRGIEVKLHQKVQSGTDAFNRPTYNEAIVIVKNVLVAPASNDDIITSTDLVGKKSVYTLGIPKGDNHDWEDAVVEFFGKTWKSFGPVVEGIEEMVPTQWHKKVMVDRYE